AVAVAPAARAGGDEQSRHGKQQPALVRTNLSHESPLELPRGARCASASGTTKAGGIPVINPLIRRLTCKNVPSVDTLLSVARDCELGLAVSSHIAPHSRLTHLACLP